MPQPIPTPPPNSPSPPVPDPVALYQARLTTLTAEHTAATNRARHLRLTLLATAALALLLTALALHGNLPLRSVLLPLAIALLVLPVTLALSTKIDRLNRLLTHVRTALARATYRHPQSGHTGLDLDAHTHTHLYSHDLQILGPDSLFGLLATTRTRLGRERLAQTLLHLPTLPTEIRARQLAIQALTPQTDLRERIALLGDRPTDEIPSTHLLDWLAQPPGPIPPSTHPLLLLTSFLAILLLLAGLTRLAPWSLIRLNLAAVLALQIAVALRARRHVSPILSASKHLPRQVALLTQGLALLASTPAATPLLQDLRSTIQPAAPALHSLNRTLSLLEQRDNQYFFLPALLLSVGTHSAISIDRWRSTNAPAMRQWIAAFAEWESLNALATYAFEHPRNTYPEILPPNHPATFEATDLRHPLLNPATAIPNPVALNPTNRFYLISGSNMAGKSTLLRTLGTATVLAQAGAPIPSTQARLSPVTLAASISIADSLADGKSKFLAEVERLHAILQAATSSTPPPTLSSFAASGGPAARPSLSSFAEGGGPASRPSLSSIAAGGGPASRPSLSSFAASGGPASRPSLSSFAAGGGPASPTPTPPPVLFLIDEIFSGTNSADRLTAAAAVLRQLIAAGALGALSTHDLTLATLADPTSPNAAPNGQNVHMASPNPEDPLAFDYTLKPGINPSTNALAILRLIGIQP